VPITLTLINEKARRRVATRRPGRSSYDNALIHHLVNAPQYVFFKKRIRSARSIAIVRRVGPHLISAGRPLRRVQVYVIRTRHLAVGGAP
jgi:hypothetical protein